MTDFSENSILPPTELENGRAYLIDSRNLAIGFWCQADKSFIGIREKFGSKYLFAEYLWDADSFGGTARPRKAIDLWAGEAPLTENLGTYCQYCDTPTISVWENPEGANYTQKGKCTGDHHTENPDCEYEGTYCATIKSNRALYELLEAADVEARAYKNY